ncbi:MAG: sugar phosphate isomerase/epimerase [Desulfomonile tiedjei]|nr:sugar phosphate isomerase/epimerase [Desulfomonile tiedjei]
MLYGAMNFPVRPVMEELEVIASLGFDYLELTMDPPQAHHTVIAQQRDEIAEALQRNKMSLVCHLPTFLSTADLSEQVRNTALQEMLDSLDVAATLNPLKVVVHPSYVMGLGVFVVDQVRQYGLNSLAALVARADELGLCLCLENMFPRTNSLVQPNDFAGILPMFPTLKMTLDTGHANIGSNRGNRCVSFVGKFPDRIEHVHVSDNFGKDDNHLPVGAGTVDFPRIIKALQGIGYDRTVTFEIFSRDRDYLKISREKFIAMCETC